MTRSGAATAAFGDVATCQLTRYGRGPVGTLISREPTGTLFSLNAGEVWCRDHGPQQEQAEVCGTGTVYLTANTTEWTATCASSHVFRVAVYAGLVQVHYPNAQKNVNLHAGLQLSYDPATGRHASSAIKFSPKDVSIFLALRA